MSTGPVRETVQRRAARVLLLDAQDRVLLFRGGDPAHPENGTWWFTVGGGMDDGETAPQAAARELYEETGLRCDPAELSGPVFENDVVFDFAGKAVHQHQVFFALTVPAHEVDVSGFEELEASSIVEHRWWDLADLRTTSDRVFPVGLADLLAGLLG